MPTAVICKIQRVQNRALWNKYFLARSDVAKECEDGRPNKIEAWHSTNTTDPRLIYSDWKAGFDVNRSTVEVEHSMNHQGHIELKIHKAGGKAYGTGVYLAEHAIYPDTVCPHTRPASPVRDGGKKQMLLAKVILGNMKDYRSFLANVRAAVEPAGYHSVSGTENDMKFLLKFMNTSTWTVAHNQLLEKGKEYGRQYVVHRSNQVFPAYLITYENESQLLQQQQQ